MPDSDDRQTLDVKSAATVVALMLTLGAGALYHLNGLIDHKMDKSFEKEAWTERQMKEYKSFEDERVRSLEDKLDRLEDQILYIQSSAAMCNKHTTVKKK